jgi:pimeloyl-ACP methyl ester carboxylesterase
MHVFYLHGFTSSPASAKAAFLRERLAALGIDLHAPDFNRPDFASLTMTRMLTLLGDAIRALPEGPVALIGSSLGGLTAIHAAARQVGGPGRPVTRLVLLAPAVDFASGRDGWLTPADVDRWRRSGRREVFHHALGRPVALAWDFYRDALAYDAWAARFDASALVFVGLRDTVVSPERVSAWAGGRDSVALRLVDDTHQLHDSLATIWRETLPFLDVPGGPVSAADPA